MGFEELKFLNTNWKEEPLNYLNYIESMEKTGEDSYILQEENKDMLRDLMMNSKLVWSHKSVRDLLFNRMTDDDAEYLLRNHSRIGGILNAYLGEDMFSTGGFNSICEYANMQAIQAFPDKFLTAFGKLVAEKIESDDALTWIRDRFNMDLTGFENLQEALENEDSWKVILTNDTFLSVVYTSPWFISEIIDTSAMIVYRSEDGNYYDEQGNQYNGETDELTGKTISTSTLQVMIDADLLTQERVVQNAVVHEKLNAAVTYLCNNNALPMFEDFPALIPIIVENEDTSAFLRDNPESLRNFLRNNGFAKQIFSTPECFNKIAESKDACQVIVDFIVAIQKSYDTMSRLTDAFEEIVSGNEDVIYDYEPLKVQMQEALDLFKERVNDLTSVQSYTNMTQTMIDALADDEDVMISMFGNEIFVKEMCKNESFAKQVVTRKKPASALSSNRRTYPIALSDETFNKVMLENDSNYEDIMISDTDKMQDVYDTDEAMSVIGGDDEHTRRFINKGLGFADDQYPTMSENIENSTWIETLFRNEFITKFGCDATSFLDLLEDSVVGMNALFASENYDKFDTERAYKVMRKHGDCSFIKWACQKAKDYGTSDTISYKTYDSFEDYCKTELSLGSAKGTNLKAAWDAVPELMLRMFLEDATYLLDILFKDGNQNSAIVNKSESIKSSNYYNGIEGGYIGVDQTSILGIFEKSKEILRENHIFFGKYLYYQTRSYLLSGSSYYREYYGYYYSTAVSDPGLTETTEVIHNNFSDFQRIDFLYYENWRVLYFSKINQTVNCCLRDWEYNSDMWMTAYLTFKYDVEDEDVNIFKYKNLEEMVSDEDYFFKAIRNTTFLNVAFASPAFMSHLVNNGTLLRLMFENWSQVETAFAVTANQDNANCKEVVYQAFLESDLLITENFNNSDGTVGLTPKEGTKTLYSGRALVLDYTHESGTTTISGFQGTTDKLEVTANTDHILRFANSLNIASTGKALQIRYIKIDG
jgi:hypothetical protein